MSAVRTHLQTQLSSLLPSPLPHPSPSYVETLEQPLSIRSWVTKRMSSPSCKKSGQKTMHGRTGHIWWRIGAGHSHRAEQATVKPSLPVSLPSLLICVTTVLLCKPPPREKQRQAYVNVNICIQKRGNLLYFQQFLVTILLNAGEDVPFDWAMINSMLSGEFWIILTAMSNVKPSRLMWFKARICPPRKITHLNTIKERKSSSLRQRLWQFKKTYLAWSF